MLAYLRSKRVGVTRDEEGRYLARGFLDDDIYSLTLEVAVSPEDATIAALEGHWLRYTTPDCPRAVSLLAEAVGLSLKDPDFVNRVHKVVGRRACRHFANLLLECCDCVLRAMAAAEGREAEFHPAPAAEPPPASAPAAGPVRAPASTGPAPWERELPPAPQGFYLDLHVHTAPASPCASSSLEEIVAEAKRIGLDGICLADHNHLWPAAAVAEMRRRYDFLILRGNEITTAQGDMLVFGLEQDIEGIVTLEELRHLVDDAGGFLIAAHPFRGFLVVGGDELGLAAEEAARRPLFSLVDALEVMNSKVTPNENRFAAQVAQVLGLPGTGGSDAHQAEEVGLFATRFPVRIDDERDLVAALRRGGYRAVAFRREKGLTG
jgi:predicted metal-dependent phosphoesterase TrpH